jgi:predicted HicB family RNase H-like nuclease
MLRIPVEVHAAVAATAEAKGKSINKWAEGVFREVCS